MSIVIAENPCLIAENATAAGSLIVPKRTAIRSVWVYCNTSAVVTGGLKMGTTAGATDVFAALALASSGGVKLLDASLSKRFFSHTTDQTIYFDAVTAWNSANINIVINLEQAS